MKITLTSNWLRNLIRTVIPSGVGGLITYFLTKWFPNLNTAWVQHFTHGGWYASLMTIATGVYYGLFRKLEMKWKWASAFLGALPIPLPTVTPSPAPSPAPASVPAPSTAA